MALQEVKLLNKKEKYCTSERHLHKCIIVVNLDNLWYIKTKYLKQHNTNFYNFLKENTIKCNLIVMDLIQINNLKDNNHLKHLIKI